MCGLLTSKQPLEALEIWFEVCVCFPLIQSQEDYLATSLRGDAHRGTRWVGSQAGPDVESPLWLRVQATFVLLVKRPGQRSTTWSARPPCHCSNAQSASRQIHRKPRHLYSQSSDQPVYNNRAMSDKIVLAQNQNPRTPPPLHFHAFTLKCHVNLLMPGLH